MNKLFSIGFWSALARFILRNRTFLLILIAVITFGLSTQWVNMRFSTTEANLLPDDHIVNLEYNTFLNKFGEEGNLVILGVKDSTLFTPEKFEAWNKLSQDILKFEEIDFTISVGDLLKLEKRKDTTAFRLVPFIKDSIFTDKNLKKYQYELFNKLPFYKGLVYSPNKQSIRTAIYMDKSIINTSVRRDFIIDDLIPIINKFEEDTGIKVRKSGMPYIRTLNAQNIIDEIGLFVGAALLVTSLLFFFFFRSFRATIIAMFTVIIGVMWAFGILGLLEYEITVLTALIPPLIIVIGIPNCIFLINKYQQEIKLHGNKAKSLQRVITKVGNATLMTNLTTASGFATFILTNSVLLKEFGIVASINIITIFLLSLFIIPIIYSYLPPPKDKHLKHLGKNWIIQFVNWTDSEGIEIGTDNTINISILSDTDILANFSLIPENIIFSHPVAGSHLSGEVNSIDDLFKGKSTILSYHDSAAPLHVNRVMSLWQELGSKVSVLDAELHDRIFAYSSHLPHVVAYALLNTLKEIEQDDLALFSGGGLGEFLRLVSSSPEMWADIFSTNGKNISLAINDLVKNLNILQNKIANDPESLQDLLSELKVFKESNY